MWVVIYGRHWIYLPYKEYRYETPSYLAAWTVHLFWWLRYSFTMYPVRYLKIYKVKDNVVGLDSYYKSSDLNMNERIRR